MRNAAIFLYILDTGGWLFARPFSILFGLAKYILSDKWYFNIWHLVLWAILILLLIPSVLNANDQGINLLSSLAYMLPILIFPIHQVLLRGLKISTNGFLKAGAYFSMFILIAFIFRLLNVGFVESFFQSLMVDTKAGYFNEKAGLFGVVIPGIYFKATLLLVPIGVLCAYYQQWFSLILVAAALFVAPSRIGVLVLTFFSVLLISYRAGVLLRYLLILAGVSLTIVFIYLFYDVIFIDAAVAYGTRYLHFESMMNYFYDNPEYLIFGGGAGSFYFTKGFGGYTDDTEIGQLETLRRYGIIFNVYLYLVFLAILNRLRKHRLYGHIYAFIAYFLVSASNPVLMSAPASLFYAFLTLVKPGRRDIR